MAYASTRQIRGTDSKCDLVIVEASDKLVGIISQGAIEKLASVGAKNLDPVVFADMIAKCLSTAQYVSAIKAAGIVKKVAGKASIAL
jgi:CBS domain-containing protein